MLNKHNIIFKVNKGIALARVTHGISFDRRFKAVYKAALTSPQIAAKRFIKIILVLVRICVD